MHDEAACIPRPTRCLRWTIGLILLTANMVAAGVGEANFGVRPIAVREGRASFDLTTPHPGSKWLVTVSALARIPGPFDITLNAKSIPIAAARALPIAVESASRPTRNDQLSPPSQVSVTDRPAWPTRVFHLLVRDGDYTSAGNYLGIEAKLAAVGRRVQVYVDSRDIAEVDPALLREVVATFDDRIYPLAATRFGPAIDVDSDGRFTIFLTSWLDRLAGGRIKVDGFVRGADYDLELGEPFGNRCDMMYLSTSLRPGAHLKTVMAHEYTHAVRFSRRAFPRGRDGRLKSEEEGWLDEGLAHLVEDLHGFSRSNLDYRVSAFLSRPEKYRLIVEDYYAADLFRSHGNRGGTYLFLRWCVDRHGEAVLDRMIRSPLRGVENLEAATGRPFSALYREWTTALFLSGLDPVADSGGAGPFRSLDLRGSIEEWILAGPRYARVKPDGLIDSWSAVGTSTHFAVLDGSESGAVRVEVVGPPNADLQVTVVPLPDNLGGLDLDVRPHTGPDGAVSVRAKVSSQGASTVRLGAIAWEPLVPAADARGSLFRRSDLDMIGIARRFGTSALAVGGRLNSRPIRLDGVRRGDGPLVFKVVGTDEGGRRVSAWAEVEVSADDSSGTDDGPAGQ